ncbi:hypothetical protein V8B97DRAFT_676354 [Scleroderma yunnanense]
MVPQGFVVLCLLFFSFSFHARVGMMVLLRLDPDKKKSFFQPLGTPKASLTWYLVCQLKHTESYLTGSFHSCVLQGYQHGMLLSHLQENFCCSELKR